MARSVSVASIMLSHISWRDDHICVQKGKSKSDQSGEASFPKAIYANPFQPWICPMLALSVMVFLRTYVTVNPSQPEIPLFEGSDQEDRFSHILSTVLTVLPDTVELGAKKSDIGTHSTRKAVLSFVMSMPGGPSSVSAYLRADWSLGNVQDRYIFEGQGGDEFCGRVVSGLSIFSTKDFPILPPHFDQSVLSSFTSTFWNNLLPGYDRFPTCFRQCLPYLLASLVHHQQYLREVLPPNHPLFNCPVFASGLIGDLKNAILLGTGCCGKTSMRATGVPPYITLGVSVDNLRAELDTSLRQVQGELQSVRESMHAELAGLPARLKATLLDNFNVLGVQQVTARDFEARMEAMLHQIMAGIEARLSSGPSSQPSAQEPTTTDQQDGASEVGPYGTWVWGGRMHPVREGFKVPRGDLKSLYLLWHFGNQMERYKPYKFLTGADMGSNAERSELAKIRTVIDQLEEIAKNEGFVSPDARFRAMEPPLPSRGEMQTMFDRAYRRLVDMLWAGHPAAREGQKSVGTIYNKVMEHRKISTSSPAVAEGP
jgi:hypothetical protein